MFHRLNVIRIHNPPLHERSEDIPLLLNHFLRRAAEELQVESKSLSQRVTEYLQSLPWAGNVRQLENICRWLTVMASGREIVMDDLPAELQAALKKTGGRKIEAAELLGWGRNTLTRKLKELGVAEG